MSIDDYLEKFESIIQSSSIVSSYNLNIDRKTEDLVFISGSLYFRNSTTLDFKEFIEATSEGLIKLKYGYNYRSASKLKFRYDNAPDPRAKNLKSYPNHKHLEKGEIIESAEVDFQTVLEKIEDLIIAIQS